MNERPKSSTVPLIFLQCTCCTPAKNLIPRSDLYGLAADGKHAMVAICPVSSNQLSVYVWEGNSYVHRKDLIMRDRQVVTTQGKPFIPAVPSTMDLREDKPVQERRPSPRQRPREGGPSPSQASHVNLGEDEFWGEVKGEHYAEEKNRFRRNKRVAG